MVPGLLSIDNQPIPAFAPPYTTDQNTFTGVSVLTIAYRTSLEDVRSLVPDCLELADEPRVTASIITYEMSTVGAYNELVHKVEVTYKGEIYDYSLSLLLDNESAIFSGREQFGFPKSFGKVKLEQSTGSNTFIGNVEKPEGHSLINFAFTPTKKLPENPTSSTRRVSLNLRLIPSPIAGAPPSIRELVPADFELIGGTKWLGNGSISFPNSLEHHPLHRVPVKRYEGSVYLHKASAVLHPPQSVFPL